MCKKNVKSQIARFGKDIRSYTGVVRSVILFYSQSKILITVLMAHMPVEAHPSMFYYLGCTMSNIISSLFKRDSCTGII